MPNKADDSEDEVGELVGLDIRGVDIVDEPAIGQPWYVVKRHTGGDMASLTETRPDQPALERASKTIAKALANVVEKGAISSDEAKAATDALDQFVSSPVVSDEVAKSIQGALDVFETHKADMPKNVHAAYATLAQAVKGARERGEMGPADAERMADNDAVVGAKSATQKEAGMTECPNCGKMNKSGAVECAACEKPMDAKAEKSADGKDATEKSAGGAEAGSPDAKTTADRSQKGSAEAARLNAAREEAGSNVGAVRSHLEGGGITKAVESATRFSGLSDALSAMTLDILKSSDEDRGGLMKAALDKFTERWQGMVNDAVDAYEPEHGEDGVLTEASAKALGAVTKMAGLTVDTEKAAQDQAQTEMLKSAMASIETGLSQIAGLAGVEKSAGAGAMQTQDDKVKMDGYAPGHQAQGADKKVAKALEGDAGAAAAITELFGYVQDGFAEIREDIAKRFSSNGAHEGDDDAGDDADVEKANGNQPVTEDDVWQIVTKSIQAARRPVHKSLGADGDTERAEGGGAASNVRKRFEAAASTRERLDLANQAMFGAIS